MAVLVAGSQARTIQPADEWADLDLEIFADDVKCSHGATIGQLDPDQLFYLRSRGLDAEEAGRMLCLGFADGIIGVCPIEGLKEQVTAALRNRLRKVDFTGGEKPSPVKQES